MQIASQDVSGIFTVSRERTRRKEVMKFLLHRKNVRWKALLMALVILISVAAPKITVQAAPNEVVQAALGVDVSRYQGVIDWNQVAASGVQFAMIRVGYRTQTTGILNEDPYARYNLQEAQRVGIKVGGGGFVYGKSDRQVPDNISCCI